MIVDFLVRLKARLSGTDEVRAKNVKHFPVVANKLQHARASIPMNVSEAQLVDLSRCWDGFVRHAALERLSVFETTVAFRAILERLNDWVPEIRRVAVARAWAYLTVERIRIVIECIDDICILSGKQRVNHSAFLNRIHSLLQESEVQPIVLALFPSLQGESARFIYKNMASWGGHRIAEVLNVAAKHKDCSVRLFAIQTCAKAPAEYRDLLSDLQKDSHPSVRQTAWRALWSASADENERANLLQRGLLDRSAGMRELAMWFARDCNFPVHELVRDTVANHSHAPINSPGLIGLIGLINDHHYLDVVIQASRSNSTAVRLAAFSARTKLSSENLAATTCEALNDQSAKVFSAGLALINKNVVSLNKPECEAIVSACLSRSQTGRALALVRLLTIWDRLELLLMIAAHSNQPADSSRMDVALLDWLRAKNRSFLPIQPPQKRVIDALLAQALGESSPGRLTFLKKIAAHL